MRAAKRRERTWPGHRGGREPRVVRIEYRPVPDAEPRLCRIARDPPRTRDAHRLLADDGERLEVR